VAMLCTDFHANSCYFDSLFEAFAAMQATSTVEMDSVQVYSHFFDLFEPLIIDFRELL